MKKFKLLGIVLFLFIFNFCIVSAETETIITKKCVDWVDVEVQVEKAPIKRPIRKIVKPLPQKMPDITSQKIVCPERKNLILLQPGIAVAYSREFKQPVFIPLMGFVYLRDITPTFSMGPGIHGAYAFYNRSFNMIGFNLNFAFKF
jgi:hypothetical protein